MEVVVAADVVSKMPSTEFRVDSRCAVFSSECVIKQYLLADELVLKRMSAEFWAQDVVAAAVGDVRNLHRNWCQRLSCHKVLKLMLWIQFMMRLFETNSEHFSDVDLMKYSLKNQGRRSQNCQTVLKCWSSRCWQWISQRWMNRLQCEFHRLIRNPKLELLAFVDQRKVEYLVRNLVSWTLMSVFSRMSSCAWSFSRVRFQELA